MRNLIPSPGSRTAGPLLFLDFFVRPPSSSGFVAIPPGRVSGIGGRRTSLGEFLRGKLSQGGFEIVFMCSRGRRKRFIQSSCEEGGQATNS
jgi:hypothetical protein